MKRLKLFVCTLLTALAINAQTIHWLTFIDTTDSNVGAIDVFNRQMLYNYFINEVNSALAEKGYKSDIQDFYANQVTPQNCKDAIDMLRITNTDDIIVFYYIGHGGRPSTDSDYIKTHPFPQMCLAQHDENKFIPLEWVDKQLSSKGARLSITIGMCCNNFDNAISLKEEPLFKPNYGATYMSKNKMQRIQELFLNYKGHVIATSASPSQTSGCFKVGNSLNPYNPADYRDRYSFSICSFFETQLDKWETHLTWKAFLDSISWFVDKYSNHEQTPIHDIHVLAASEQEPVIDVPDDVDISQTQQKQKSNITKKPEDTKSDKWKNELTNHLTTLRNTNIPFAKRLELEKRVSSITLWDA